MKKRCITPLHPLHPYTSTLNTILVYLFKTILRHAIYSIQFVLFASLLL